MKPANQVLLTVKQDKNLDRSVVHENMGGSRKFCQRGSNFDMFFVCFLFVDERREDPNTTISGPSLAWDGNAI